MNRYYGFNLILATLFTVATTPAFAALVVDYNHERDGYNNVSLDNPSGSGITIADLDNDGNTDDASGWFDDQPFADAALSRGSYNGPTIYGGVRIQRLDATSASADDRKLAPINIRVQANSANPERVHGGLYWKVDSSNYPLGVMLDGTSWLGMSDAETGGSDGLGADAWVNVRALLQDVNGDYYVSQTSFGNGSVAAQVFDSTELATMMWQGFDPIFDIDFDQDAATYSTSTNDLNAIGLQGFGVYFQADVFRGERHWLQNLDIYNVNATAIEPQQQTAVPEPATVGLAMLGAAALGFRRRRNA